MRHFGKDKNGAACRDIRPHLKEIDHLFDITFDFDSERYEITFNGALFQTVPWKELDQSLINKIRQVYWTNVNGDPLRDVEEHNERLEQSRELAQADLVKDLAKDIKKALLKEGY